MKGNRNLNFLFIIGIICLPLILYKYYTLGDSDFKYLLGVLLCVWLIYDYHIYKSNKTHILKTLKENFKHKGFDN